MKKKLRKSFAYLLSICMLVTMFFGITISSFASGEKEMPDISGHWAASEISKWVSLGLAKGGPDGTFKPDDAITRAEFVAFVNRVFNYTEKSEITFKDVDGTAWYADDIAKAVKAGILKGDGAGNANPDLPITRQEAAVILARAFNLEAENPDAADVFEDSVEIASWAKESVSVMVENGYIAGRPGNIVAPLDDITRAETVKMIDNAMGELKNAAGTYTDSVEGNLVVNTAGVELKDMVIGGDLYLTEGIGDGDVTLDGVTVKGRTLIKGGGENSIIINNSSLEGTVAVLKIDGRIRIVAAGSSEIARLQLNSGATLQTQDLTGTGFESVEILGVLSEGQEITLEGALVSIGENATVEEFTANAAVKVVGEGTIKNAVIKAEGVSLEKEPENITIAEDVSVIIGGEETTDEDLTPPIGGITQV